MWPNSLSYSLLVSLSLCISPSLRNAGSFADLPFFTTEAATVRRVVARLACGDQRPPRVRLNSLDTSHPTPHGAARSLRE